MPVGGVVKRRKSGAGRIHVWQIIRGENWGCARWQRGGSHTKLLLPECGSHGSQAGLALGADGGTAGAWSVTTGRETGNGKREMEEAGHSRSDFCYVLCGSESSRSIRYTYTTQHKSIRASQLRVAPLADLCSWLTPPQLEIQ